MNIDSHQSTKDLDGKQPILIVPYMWIGDFVRGHSVVKLLQARFPGRPIENRQDQFLAELDEDTRAVFVLFHEQGQAYEEIAEAIERPVGTVKTWLHRARVELLERLRSRGLVP